MKKSFSEILLIVLVFIILVTILPFSIIWSLNTLFPVLAIPYNISTWAAMSILLILLNGKMEKK